MNGFFFTSFAITLLALAGFCFIANWTIEKVSGLIRWLKICGEDDALMKWERRRYGSEVKPSGPYCSITPSNGYPGACFRAKCLRTRQ